MSTRCTDIWVILIDCKKTRKLANKVSCCLSVSSFQVCCVDASEEESLDTSLYQVCITTNLPRYLYLLYILKFYILLSIEFYIDYHV